MQNRPKRAQDEDGGGSEDQQQDAQTDEKGRTQTVDVITEMTSLSCNAMFSKNPYGFGMNGQREER